MKETHKNTKGVSVWLRVLPIVTGLVFCLRLWADEGLSALQEALVAKDIANMSEEERRIVASWPPSKKLAEFFCKPLALKEFQKEDPHIDKVVLGPGDQGDLDFILEGNHKLSGRGMFRAGTHWRTFRFDCLLDPDKVAAQSFQYQMD